MVSLLACFSIESRRSLLASSGFCGEFSVVLFFLVPCLLSSVACRHQMSRPSISHPFQVSKWGLGAGYFDSITKAESATKSFLFDLLALAADSVDDPARPSYPFHAASSGKIHPNKLIGICNRYLLNSPTEPLHCLFF